jgi:hypothetical protein
VLIGPNGIFDDADILEAKGILKQRFFILHLTPEIINTKLIDVEGVIFKKLIGNGVVMYFFLGSKVLWEFGDIFIPFLIIVIGISMN